jgi:hypothetical protein
MITGVTSRIDLCGLARYDGTAETYFKFEQSTPCWQRIESTPYSTEHPQVIEIHDKHDNPFGSEPIYRAYERLQDGSLFNLRSADLDPAVLEARLRGEFTVFVRVLGLRPSIRLSR